MAQGLDAYLSTTYLPLCVCELPLKQLHKQPACFVISMAQGLDAYLSTTYLPLCVCELPLKQLHQLALGPHLGLHVQDTEQVRTTACLQPRPHSRITCRPRARTGQASRVGFDRQQRTMASSWMHERSSLLEIHCTHACTSTALGLTTSTRAPCDNCLLPPPPSPSAHLPTLRELLSASAAPSLMRMAAISARRP